MARRKYAFLVHMWLDAPAEDLERASDWRGSVEHLETQRRLYFTAFLDLVAFLSSYTTGPPDDRHRDR